MSKIRITAFILVVAIYMSLSGCSLNSLNVNIHPSHINLQKDAKVAIEFKNNTGKMIYVLSVGNKKISYVPDLTDKSRKYLEVDYSMLGYYMKDGGMVFPYDEGNSWPRVISIPPGKSYKDSINISTGWIRFDKGEYKLHITAGYNFTPITIKDFISRHEYLDWAKIVRSNPIKAKI